MTYTQTLDYGITNWNLAYTSDILKFVGKVRTQFTYNKFYDENFMQLLADNLKSVYPSTAVVHCQEDGEVFIHFHDINLNNTDEVMNEIIDNAFKTTYVRYRMEVAQSLRNSETVERFYEVLHNTKNIFYDVNRLNDISFMIRL